MAERIDAIVEFLKTCGSAKPRAAKTLSNPVNSLFMKRLEEEELAKIMVVLVRQKVVDLNVRFATSACISQKFKNCERRDNILPCTSHKAGVIFK